MQQHGSKYFASKPPPLPNPGGGVKIKLFQNMVKLHIKLNGIFNASVNMVANILPASPLPCWSAQKVKNQLFQNMVMLHIKLKGITNAVTW